VIYVYNEKPGLLKKPGFFVTRWSMIRIPENIWKWFGPGLDNVRVNRARYAIT